MWLQLISIFICLCLLDTIMLGLIVRPMWMNTIHKIQGSPLKVRFQYALISYIFITLGVYIFVLPRIRQEHWIYDCILWGGLWGLITYGIFDTTNGAIFSGYPLSIAVIDTMWGGILISLVCLMTVFLQQKIEKK